MNEHEWQLRMNDLCDGIAAAVVDQALADRKRHDIDPAVARLAAEAMSDAQAREDRFRGELVEHALAGVDAGFLMTRSVDLARP